MIIRLLTAHVKPGRVSHFNAVIRTQLPILREQPGLVYVKLARRLEADGGEIVILFEEWRDPDSVYAWAGPNLARPRLPAGAEESLSDLQVLHYESLDVIPAELDEVLAAQLESEAGPATAPSGAPHPPEGEVSSG